MAIILMFSGLALLSAGLLLFLRQDQSKSPQTTSNDTLEQIIKAATADGVLTNNEKNFIGQAASEAGLDPQKALRLAEDTVRQLNQKPETEVIDYKERNGKDFESFVIQKFEPKFFKVKQWTGDKYVNGIYAKSNMDPDLLMELRLGRNTYLVAVECKWRSSGYISELQIAEEKQLNRYRQYQKRENIPVFIVLGVGGSGEAPERLFILPINEVSSAKMTYEQLKDKERDISRNFFFDTEKQILR